MKNLGENIVKTLFSKLIDVSNGLREKTKNTIYMKR